MGQELLFEVPEVDLEVEFFSEDLVTVAAKELGHAPVDHLLVFVQVALLGELHLALVASVWLFARMGAQVVEVLAHREYRKVARLAAARIFMLALKQLKLSRLSLGPQEVVHAVLLGGRNVNVFVCPLLIVTIYFLIGIAALQRGLTLTLLLQALDQMRKV